MKMEYQPYLFTKIKGVQRKTSFPYVELPPEVR